jgi:hypothetical protein
MEELAIEKLIDLEIIINKQIADEDSKTYDGLEKTIRKHAKTEVLIELHKLIKTLA